MDRKRIKIKKAILPVGGLGTRFLPATKAMPKEMLPIIDKPLIQYAVEEALEAGIEELIFVTGRGKSAIENHFDHSIELENTLIKLNNISKLNEINKTILKPGSFAYVRQQEPAGLGHAVWCARNLVKKEPVAIILADDLIDSNPGCMKQMIDNWTGGNMVAIMNVPKEKTSSYGIISPGENVKNLVEIKNIVEKPSVEQSPSTLAVVGRYIIESEVFDDLSLQKKGLLDEIQLTDSLASQIGKAPLFGYSFTGKRYDCGTKLGFIEANISLALKNQDLGPKLKEKIKSLIAD